MRDLKFQYSLSAGSALTPRCDHKIDSREMPGDAFSGDLETLNSIFFPASVTLVRLPGRGETTLKKRLKRLGTNLLESIKSP